MPTATDMGSNDTGGENRVNKRATNCPPARRCDRHNEDTFQHRIITDMPNVNTNFDCFNDAIRLRINHVDDAIGRRGTTWFRDEDFVMIGIVFQTIWVLAGLDLLENTTCILTSLDGSLTCSLIDHVNETIIEASSIHLLNIRGNRNAMNIRAIDACNILILPGIEDYYTGANDGTSGQLCLGERQFVGTRPIMGTKQQTGLRV